MPASIHAFGSVDAALSRFRREPLARAGLIVLVALAATCVVGPAILDRLGIAARTIDLEAQFEPPSFHHWLGADRQGRDLLARLLEGGRLSLAIGILGASVSLALGGAYGAAAGLAGGRTDRTMMRVVDLLYGLPYMVIVILLGAYLGRSVLVLFLALGLVEWLTPARIARGEVARFREREFVLAARALGSTNRAIFRRHLVRNLLPVLVAYLALTVPRVILFEAFLSYLGLGVQPPDVSWGLLAADGVQALTPVRVYWWLVLFPAAALALTLLSLNWVGEGLRAALDPKRRA
ncbi:MAG: ABC transporter permease [Planctomycetes bacterium]|nr:ABC transporter permease [Planctomycetota bacterium]MBI3846817.1 ABC transporter permease [Planctomycetota bacterium]